MQERNERLFYQTLTAHIERLLPIIYTPTVGEACREFSHIASEPKGFFITPQVFSSVSQRNVLAGVLPLRTMSGEFDGVIALTWDVSWLDFMLRTKQIPKDAAVAVFDTENTMVAANDRAIAADIFRNAIMPGNTSSRRGIL